MRRFLRRLSKTIIILCIIFAFVFFVFRTKYYSAIEELAKTQIRNATSDLINDAIDRQIENQSIQYDRMIYFEKDLDGKITALKTNMSEVNRMKTNILNTINDEILALDTSDLGIPLGSILVPEFFSGRGLTVPVQIHSIRNSDGAFTSEFSEAGINQTLQRLTMDVSVDVTVLILGQTSSFTVVSQVVIAETIIVGQVPDTFFHYGG